MPPALKTDVSILRLARGRRDYQTPAARIVEPASGIAPAEGKGNLYILLELEGGDYGRARLYRELLNTIQETYYYHRDAIPGALTAALRAAHSYVQQYNQYHHTDFRGGATCLVVTGSEVASAQAGPTILALRSQAGLQWFSPLNREDYRPLGGDAPPQVEIGRVSGHAGIVIVAMTSAWANHLDVGLMQDATAVPHAQAVADQLAGIGIHAADELTLLVVALTATDGVAQAATPLAAAPPQPRAAPAAASEAWQDEFEDEMWEEVGEEEEMAAEAPAPAGMAAAARSRLPQTPRVAPKSAARERRPATAARAPARAKPPQRTAVRRIPFALLIAAMLLVAVLVVTAGMWYLQGQQRAELVAQYLNGARVNYQAALDATDENQIRLYLAAAREQLDQAVLLAPEELDIPGIRNQIAEAEARVNRVQPILTGFDLPLISFDSAANTPRRVFVHGLNVYVLDAGQNSLRRYQLDDVTADRLAAGATPQVLIQSGDQVQERRVGELSDAVWAPAAGNRTATGPLVLDRSTQLFGNVEGLGPVNVPLTVNDGLGFASRMHYYAGNLYILDTTSSQLWRYRPTGDSYTLPAESYFTGDAAVNLSTVIDLAIDGAVWLLHPNGTVLKYFAGVQEPFALDVVQPPLGDAVAIWANEADVPGGRLFIADAASNRIVVFDKRGRLLAQLMPVDRPGVLNDLRSIYVDEASNYLYALTALALYQVPLPPIAAE